MSARMRSLAQIKQAYELSLRIPSLKSARIQAQSQTVEVTWQQACLASGTNMAQTTVYSLPTGSGSPSTGLGQASSGSGLEAVWGDQKATIQKVTNAAKDELWVLRVFERGCLIKSWNLSDLNLHRAVYLDQELGGLAWDTTGERLVYVAEAKEPVSQPFFKRVTADSSSSSPPAGKPGQQFQLGDEFGEQMVGQSRPVIVLVHLESEQVETLDGIIPQGWCPGQLTWYKNQIIGIAVHMEPFHLGLVYCSNRPGVIFALDLDQKSYQVLSSKDHVSCKSPRVLKTRDLLVWLERDLSREHGYPGPHMSCNRLMKRDLSNENAIPEVVVPVQTAGNDKGFFGLYGSALPERCFGQDKFVLLSTVNRDGIAHPLSINVLTHEVLLDGDHPHVTTLDSHGGFVVGVHATPTTSPKLVGGIMSQDGRVGYVDISKSPDLKPMLPSDCLWRSDTHQPTSEPAIPFSSFYVGTESGPLILYPHGGPHAVTPATFIAETTFFNLLGFNVLKVNYRGSLGAGQDSVDSLLGRIGRQDVDDCMQALDQCLQDHPGVTEVLLAGGSHGGFLVAHLAGQFPDRFKGVVARNPVINVSTMATVSDIPDWTFNESGLTYEFKSPTPEIMRKMFEMSPIHYVDRVQAPVYLMIGQKDLRVPPSQGQEYYRNLKARGKKVQMNVYEDNHPLAKVPVAANVAVNTALFFQECLESHQ